MSFQGARRTQGRRRRWPLAARLIAGLAVAVGGGCLRIDYVKELPVINAQAIRAHSEGEEKLVTQSEMNEREKSSLWHEADVRAADLREHAAKLRHKVAEKCDDAVNSDIVVCTMTVVAVPFFFIAQHPCGQGWYEH